MKRLFGLFAVAALFSCEKIEVDEIHNLNNGKVFIIGHAGEGFNSHINHYPFNSKGSISRALNFHKADGIEVDVQLTKDHRAILYHDDYLDTQTDCGGSIYNFNYEDLLKCRYNSDIHPSLFQKMYLIGLDEVYSLCMNIPEPKPMIFLDIKLNPTNLNIDMEAYKDSLVADLIQSIQNYIPEKVHFISEDVDLLKKFKALTPESKFHLAGGNSKFQISTAITNGFTGIIGTEDDYETEDTAEAHRNNLTVTLFGVTSLDDIDDALELNPDYIHSDNIPLLQSVLRSL